jgi:hypothetical protein
MNSLNKTRAIYSISLVGFALTSAGCGDPIIDDPIVVDPIIADLTVITFADLAIPTVEIEVDPATNITYTYTYGVEDLTIGEDLKTVFDSSLVITETDAAGVEINRIEIKYAFDGVVTPVEVGANYTIKFTAQANAANIVDLTCTLADLNLDCTDQDNKVWAFQIK